MPDNFINNYLLWRIKGTSIGGRCELFGYIDVYGSLELAVLPVGAEPDGVESVWVVKEVGHLWVSVDVFPASATPPAWHEMKLLPSSIVAHHGLLVCGVHWCFLQIPCVSLWLASVMRSLLLVQYVLSILLHLLRCPRELCSLRRFLSLLHLHYMCPVL